MDLKRYYDDLGRQQLLAGYALGAKVSAYALSKPDLDLEQVLGQIAEGDLTLIDGPITPGIDPPPHVDDKGLGSWVAAMTNARIRGERTAAIDILAAINDVEVYREVLSSTGQGRLEEALLRRRDFGGGRPTRLADGQDWYLPTDATARLAPQFAAYDAAVAATPEEPGPCTVYEAMVGIASNLLLINYHLDVNSMVRLLDWRSDDPLSNWGEILCLAGGADRVWS